MGKTFTYVLSILKTKTDKKISIDLAILKVKTKKNTMLKKHENQF